MFTAVFIKILNKKKHDTELLQLPIFEFQESFWMMINK